MTKVNSNLNGAYTLNRDVVPFATVTVESDKGEDKSCRIPLLFII